MSIHKRQNKIVASDINVWCAEAIESLTGQKVPDDLVEKEIAAIAAEKAAAAAGKNPAAVALGRLGGMRGGPARAKALSPEQRKEIAKNAAEARWSKNKAVSPR